MKTFEEYVATRGQEIDENWLTTAAQGLGKAAGWAGRQMAGASQWAQNQANTGNVQNAIKSLMAVRQQLSQDPLKSGIAQLGGNMAQLPQSIDGIMANLNQLTQAMPKLAGTATVVQGQQGQQGQPQQVAVGQQGQPQQVAVGQQGTYAQVQPQAQPQWTHSATT